MCPGGSKKLFAKAYKEALIPQEQEQLIAEFKSDVKLVYHVGLTPQKVCMHYSCSPQSELKGVGGCVFRVEFVSTLNPKYVGGEYCTA